MDLLERLGGRAVVQAVADTLFDRLLADDEIGPLFADTHEEAQRAAFTAYLVDACTERPGASSERLRVAHDGRGVTDRHFSIMASYLADILDGSAVEADAAADLLDLVAARRADVVSSSAVAGTWMPRDPST